MKQFVLLAFLALGISFAQTPSPYTPCAGCHQATGAGLPGVFPPLVEHVPEILNAKGGREYIIQLVLNGLQGEIVVKGQKFKGAMPALAQLKDDQIAAALNHVATQWGNEKLLPANHKPFTAEEIKAAREKKITAAQMYDLRKTLGLK